MEADFHKVAFKNGRIEVALNPVPLDWLEFMTVKTFSRPNIEEVVLILPFSRQDTFPIQKNSAFLLFHWKKSAAVTAHT